ncbi:MAG: hypothetical protein ACC662_07770 [Planctomycetota bacterium]
MEKGRFGPFRLLGELGSGVSAVVYRAEVAEAAGRLQPGDQVALKVLQAHYTAHSTIYRRFLREIRITRRTAPRSWSACSR